MKKILSFLFGLLIVCSTLASVSAMNVGNNKDIAVQKVDIKVVKNTPTDQIVEVSNKNIRDLKRLYITKIIKKGTIRRHIMIDGEPYYINIKAKKVSENKYYVTETICGKNGEIANLKFTVIVGNEKNYVIKSYNVNIENDKEVAIGKSLAFPNPDLDLYINVGGFGNVYGSSTEYMWSGILTDYKWHLSAQANLAKNKLYVTWKGPKIILVGEIIPAIYYNGRLTIKDTSGFYWTYPWYKIMPVSGSETFSYNHAYTQLHINAYWEYATVII